MGVGVKQGWAVYNYGSYGRYGPPFALGVWSRYVGGLERSMETDMPAGRPTKYRPEYCDEVLKLGRQGKSKTQIAGHLGVAWSTFQDWEAKHEEFRAAIKEAQRLAQLWWEDLGQRMAQDGTGNATAFIFQMKNRFRDSYRDKIDHDHKADVTFTVATGVPERPNRETHDEDDGEVD